MADIAALLVEEILPYQPMRQLAPGMARSRTMQEQLSRVLSVPFPLRFLFASNPKAMTGALGIVYRAISTHLAHKAGFAKSIAQTGAVTLIQRFGSALNLNIHLMCMDARMSRAHGCAGATHSLFLDGVYIGDSNEHPLRFLRVKAPTGGALLQLTHTIAHRVVRYLERPGLLERDTGNIYLTPEAVDASDEDPSNQLLGSSITYRIAVGPQQGRKVFTLQALPGCGSENPIASTVGEVGGFSLHAGVATNANERVKLERLCRYIARPAVTTKRLSMTRNGRVRYELKTPWFNGTTHVIFEPLDFMYRMYGMPWAQGCAGTAISRLVAYSQTQS